MHLVNPRRKILKQDSVALMAQRTFERTPAFNCDIDLWSEGDLSYGTFFTSLILLPVIQCINEVLADTFNTHFVFLIAQPAVMATISLSLSICGLCNVIGPPYPTRSPPHPIGGL